MEKKRSVPFAPLLMLLLLLVLGSKMVVQTEGRRCLSQSHRFKGPCVRDSNCASVCRTEGFPGGDCRGFLRRCFCTRNC